MKFVRCIEMSNDRQSTEVVLLNLEKVRMIRRYDRSDRDAILEDDNGKLYEVYGNVDRNGGIEESIVNIAEERVDD